MFKINNNKHIFKSISSLADYIGITRKTLYERAKVNRISLSGSYNDEQMELLKTRIGINKQNKHVQYLRAIEKENELLKCQIMNKDKEIIMLNKHIKKAQILISQSQQLQLIAEKKIAALEAPKQTEDDADQNKESPVTSAPKGPILPSTDNQKRGFWHKFFK